MTRWLACRPTIENVTTAVLLVVAGLVGSLMGAGLVLVTRRRGLAGATTPPSLAVSPEVQALLAALSSHAMVLDDTLEVVKLTPGTRTLGVVADRRITAVDIAEAAARTLRDREVRESEVDLPARRRGQPDEHLQFRIAPLGPDHLLVLLENRTQQFRLEKMRRDFVVNASHELKTPIGALGLLSEAVLDGADDPEAVRRFARRMQGESTRLATLVQEIIDLSRLQYDEPVLSAAPIALKDIIGEALDRCRVDAEARDIRLVTGGAVDTIVAGDRTQLVTAVGNLVENAIAYSPDQTRVAVGVRRRDGMAEITVTDQGIGIPGSEQGRIFERFYRVDPARSRHTGGTGLGLAIVKHIAAGHGGDVSVWSVEGAGSTFTLRLPRMGIERPAVEAAGAPQDDRRPDDIPGDMPDDDGSDRYRPAGDSHETDQDKDQDNDQDNQVEATK